MGLGGFLAARTDAEHFESELKREHFEVENLRDREATEVEDILGTYGLTGTALKSLTEAITANRERWIEVMMRFELGLEKPDPRRALISALTIGLA
jgi:vacuolar iron transporter family protein